jgi:hypothetical protein
MSLSIRSSGQEINIEYLFLKKKVIKDGFFKFALKIGAFWTFLQLYSTNRAENISNFRLRFA